MQEKKTDATMKKNEAFPSPPHPTPRKRHPSVKKLVEN